MNLLALLLLSFTTLSLASITDLQTLIPSATKNTTFDLVTLLVIKLEVIKGFLRYLSESDTRFELSHFFNNIKELDNVVFNKNLFSMICGQYKCPGNKFKEDLVNLYQKDAIMPWTCSEKPSWIKFPILSMPKSKTFTDADKEVTREAMNRGDIEFECLIKKYWRHYCQSNLVKYARPIIENSIISRLEAIFSIQIFDFNSIYSIFDTDMPVIQKKYGVTFNNLIDLFVKFPDYNFTP